MRVFRSTLVLFSILVMGLSLAVPADDLPETAYDDSESQPYEMTPLLSAQVVQEPVSALQVVSSAPSVLFPTPRHALNLAGCRELAAHHASDSLIILDHSLRC